MTRRVNKEKEKRQQAQLRKRHKGCTSKRSYNTLLDAEGYAKMYSDSRYCMHGSGVAYRAYFCRCGKFHLTSSKKKDRVEA